MGKSAPRRILILAATGITVAALGLGPGAVSAQAFWDDKGYEEKYAKDSWGDKDGWKDGWNKDKWGKDGWNKDRREKDKWEKDRWEKDEWEWDWDWDW